MDVVLVGHKRGTHTYTLHNRRQYRFARTHLHTH